MNLSVKHLQQYKKIAGLLWKYGRSDIVKGMGFGDAVDADEVAASRSVDTSPTELADDLEAMGPTYVKLGQVLASRPDILPRPYINALPRLHDGVKPFSFAEVEEIVTAELGVRISKAFSHFEATPLAAASLGQVHSATLRDGDGLWSKFNVQVSTSRLPRTWKYLRKLPSGWITIPILVDVIGCNRSSKSFAWC